MAHWRHASHDTKGITLTAILVFQSELMRARRCVQGVCAAVGDVCVYGLARRLWDQRVANWTLFCQVRPHSSLLGGCWRFGVQAQPT